MESFRVPVEEILQELRTTIRTDFAAFACIEKRDQTLRWRNASGNRNERYKRIVLPIGKGFCGAAIRSGRPIVIPSFSPKSGDDPCEYPIFVAENLQSMMIAPVLSNGWGRGVLLVGCREPRSFSGEELQVVVQAAASLSQYSGG